MYRGFLVASLHPLPRWFSPSRPPGFALTISAGFVGTFALIASLPARLFFLLSVYSHASAPAGFSSVPIWAVLLSLTAAGVGLRWHRGLLRCQSFVRSFS